MATSTINQIMNNSGTNYCKMPDGTLIQWGTDQVVTETSPGSYPALGNNMYRGVKTISYTIPFISKPAVIVDGDNRLYGAFGSNASDSLTTNTQFIVEGGHNAPNVTIEIYWIAVGRWK